MSINQTNIIDFIGTTHDEKVVLTISDHHCWEKTWHLQLLEDKLNSYLQFIESGQLLKDYPAAVDKDVIIRTVIKYEPNSEALTFLKKCKEIINNAGFGFEWQTLYIKE